MWNIGDAGGKGTAFKLAQCSQITLRRNENLVRNTTVSQMRKDGFESTSDYKVIILLPLIPCTWQTKLALLYP